MFKIFVHYKRSYSYFIKNTLSESLFEIKIYLIEFVLD